MTRPIVFDFDAIAAEVRALEAPQPVEQDGAWWCDDCQIEVPDDHVWSGPAGARHDEQKGGCGCFVHEACDECENSGFVFSSYQASGGPNLEVCDRCYNPFGHDCP